MFHDSIAIEVRRRASGCENIIVVVRAETSVQRFENVVAQRKRFAILTPKILFISYGLQALDDDFHISA